MELRESTRRQNKSESPLRDSVKGMTADDYRTPRYFKLTEASQKVVEALMMKPPRPPTMAQMSKEAEAHKQFRQLLDQRADNLEEEELLAQKQAQASFQFNKNHSIFQPRAALNVDPL